jgi:hypothetical protein
MSEVAAHLTDHVLPHVPARQWVLSVPKRLRPYLHHDVRVAGAPDLAPRDSHDAPALVAVIVELPLAAGVTVLFETVATSPSDELQATG